MAAKRKYFPTNGDIIGNCIYLQEEGFIKNKLGNIRAALFICSYCGNTFINSFSKVKSNTISSCGCYRKKFIGYSSITHGMSKTSEYKIWQSMKNRCYNKNVTHFESYGGRGIIVCDRWLESFENFIEDMGERPTQLHSLERRKNNGNYEKSNCYWATDEIQANNKRNNHLITYNDKTLTMAQWSRETGIPLSSLEGRIYSNKSLDKIFSQERLKGGFKKGHQTRKGCIASNATPFETIFKIQSLYLTGQFTKSELAHLYKVDNSSVGNFIKNQESIINKYKLCQMQQI